MNKSIIIARIVGSCMVVSAYFVVLHVSVTAGVVMNIIADTISLPYFIRTKSWDVVVMLAFLMTIGISKLVTS
jgi:hypothetical protein